MWQKLIEILLKKYFDRKTPTRKAVKALVGLYVSMVNCYEAYKVVKDSPDALAADTWHTAIESLSDYLYDLRFALRIHDPELYAIIVEYTLKEGESMERYWQEVAQKQEDVQKEASDMWRLRDRRRAIKFRISDFTRCSIDLKERRLEFNKGFSDDIPTNDFEEAILQLGSFIKQHYTFEDVLDV